MYDVINRINEKVVKLQKNRTSEGYVNGEFPPFNDGYPCLAEWSTRYWNKTWHEQRLIEYVKTEGLWLSTQLFVNNNSTNFDLEYYSYIESLSILTQNQVDDTLFVFVNNELAFQEKFNKSLILFDFKYIMMLGDSMSIYLSSNNNFDFQIKYRLVG